MNRLESKRQKRIKRKLRVRKKIMGTDTIPRLTVYKSNKNISVQVVDDIKGKTIVSVSTLEKKYTDLNLSVESGKIVGKEIAERLNKLGVNTIVFDRNGYLYHGIVKAVADSARESGLKF